MPLKLALGVRGTVAGHRLGALEGGGGNSSVSNASLGVRATVHVHRRPGSAVFVHVQSPCLLLVLPMCSGGCVHSAGGAYKPRYRLCCWCVRDCGAFRGFPPPEHIPHNRSPPGLTLNPGMRRPGGVYREYALWWGEVSRLDHWDPLCPRACRVFTSGRGGVNRAPQNWGGGGSGKGLN